MANSAPALISLSTRQQVMLERLKAGNIKGLESFLKSAAKAIRDRLASDELTAVARSRAEAQLVAIRNDLKAIYGDAGKQITSDLKGLADYATGAEARALDAVLMQGVELTVPSANQVLAAAMSRPLTSGQSAKMLEPFINGWVTGSIDSVENAIRLGYLQGRTNRELINEVVGTAKNNYKDGIIDATYRNAQAVVRTSVQHVAQVARSEMWAQNADIITGYEWVSTLDLRTTLQCGALDSRVFEVGKGPLPPIHINCLVGDSLVTSCGDITGASKRWFDGEVVTIKTSAGRSLTCTPNHPVLTSTGWIAAGLLNDTHEIVCRNFIQRLTSADAQDNNCPPTISQVTEAFLANIRVVPVPMPSSAPDFHGDGAGSKVAIVGANSGLLPECDASGREHSGQFRFVARHNAASGERPIFKLFCASLSTPNSIMGRFSKVCNLLRARCAHAGLLLLRAIPLTDSIFVEDALNRIRAYSKSLCNSSNADAVIEKTDNFVRVNALDGAVAFRFYVDSDAMEMAQGRALSYSDLAASILNCDAGQVKFDKLVEKVLSSFSGHVYNLETVDGFYYANGIVTHNCRSSTAPVIANKYIRDTLRQGATRVSNGDTDGPVSAGTSYYEWLKTQPAGFQDEALGPMRAQLFRDGGLSAQRFQELQLGKQFEPLTLDQMKELEPVAFERAGL